MGRVFNGVVDNRVFRLGVGAVFQIGTFAALFEKSRNAAFFDGIPVTVKCSNSDPI